MLAMGVASHISLSRPGPTAARGGARRGRGSASSGGKEYVSVPAPRKVAIGAVRVTATCGTDQSNVGLRFTADGSALGRAPGATWADAVSKTRSVLFSAETLTKRQIPAVRQKPAEPQTSSPAAAGKAKEVQVAGRALATTSLLVLYFACVVLRAPLEVAMPGLVADAASTTFTTAGVGALMAMASATQALGKIINSFIVDRSSPAAHMLVLTGVAASATLLLPILLHSSFALTAACYCTVRFCCGGVWLAATKLMRTWHGPETLGGAIGMIAMISRGAAAFAALACGKAVGALPPSLYGRIFIPAGAVAVLGALLARPFLREGPGFAPVVAPPAPSSELRMVGAGEASQARSRTLLGLSEEEGAEDLSAFEVLQRIARTEALWWMLLGRVCATSMLELSCFLPMFVVSSLGVPAGVAGQVTAAFTVGCGLSVVFGGRLYGRLPSRGRVRLVIACMASFSAAAAALALLTPSLATAVPLIFLMGCSAAVPFYIPFTLFSNAHGGRYSATVEGLTECAAMMAMVLFDVAVGRLAATSWPRVLALSCATVSVGAVAMRKLLSLEVKKEEEEAAARLRREGGRALGKGGRGGRRAVAPSKWRRWGRVQPI